MLLAVTQPSKAQEFEKRGFIFVCAVNVQYILQVFN